MEIHTIKAQLTIGQVLQHYNLQPNGSNMLHCPFHTDKTPSLQVYPKTNTFCCFSSNCTAGSGDVIDFIGLMETLSASGVNLDKHEALLKAKALLGVTAINSKPLTNSLPKVVQSVQSQITKQPMPEISRQAILTKFYSNSLLGMPMSPKAKEYAESRGLNWQQLRIGSIGEKVSANWNATYLQQAAAIGLLKKRGQAETKYEHHFKNSLVFPLVNQQGQVVSLYGRSIQSKALPAESASGGVGRHIYLSGERQGLYPNYPPLETQTLILTESIIDAATLSIVALQSTKPSEVDLAKQGLQQLPDITHQYAVLALYGTNGWNKEHTAAISQLKALQEIILFFDGDAAGRKATANYTEKLQQLVPNIQLSAIETPENEDINSLAVNHQGKETELFTHLIEQRTVLFSSDNHRKEKPAPLITNNLITNTPITNQLITTNPSYARLRTENSELLHYRTQPLDITILGGIRITGLDRLRVTLKIEPTPSNNLLPIRHSLDLYNSKQVAELVRQTSEQYELSEQEVQQVMASLTGELETYRNTKLEAMKPKKKEKKLLSSDEKKTALDYLKAPNLLERTSKDIALSGLVGEPTNAMIAYITYTGRKREKPLHIMCLGVSGSGKTYLQEKIGELIPEEDKLEITTLSDNAFYYFGKEELKHKLILIEDLDGAENVLYPLRELQSKRKISKTVTLKDNKGNLKTITLEVNGPVSVSSCTTKEKMYEDNANRCILLYIDASKAQDKRILEYQKSESAGKVNYTTENAIKAKCKNMQRMLQPIKVVNPYAELIDLPEEVFKPRRTLSMLLGLIETITFYHQYQRAIKIDTETVQKGGQANGKYIESTVEDVAYGFRLMREVLFRKSDELSGACRSFFEALKEYLKTKPTTQTKENLSSEGLPQEGFYKRAIRSHLRMNPNNLKRYLRELQAYGHLKVTGGSKYRGYEYSLTEAGEYEQLKEQIDKQLDAILQKIKACPTSGGNSQL